MTGKGRQGPHRSTSPGERGAYLHFTVNHHVKTLLLGEDFLSSITPQTRILEVGFGSGQLTNFLMKKSALSPKNITLLDFDYRSLEYVQSSVRRLIKKGVIKHIKSDVVDYNHPENAYDHIIMPESHFRRMGVTMDKLVPALKPGGTIRMSNVPTIDYRNFHKTDFFNKLGLEVVEHNGRGLILRKRAA
tara:strand:+ start:4030 stop:4596 length:567 start_codon:yes stop_codon:yes gene_type:complete